MQWLVEHPDYLLNQLFIGADSYSGISAPIVVKQIIDGNFMILLLEKKKKFYIYLQPICDS
jgi:serine carboxypeptidase-like clade 1